MTTFKRLLKERQPNPGDRKWIYVPYDQVSQSIGPLSRTDPNRVGIVLVETPWKAARRPYHKQKLAIILANLRHFALEQASRGVAVEHLVVNAPYRLALAGAAQRLGPLEVMRPAERELRSDLQPLFKSGALREVPHEGWLTNIQQFRASHPNGPPYLLERFYRFVRKQSGILMDGRNPVGGKFNFDKENRSPFKGKPPSPPPSYSSDPIKTEVGELIESTFSHHPGTLDIDSLPGTLEDAERLWSWAKTNALPLFGKYEDAMSTRSSTLFHTRLSALLNIHRLLPARIVAEASELDIPIASKEGFIRQVLGWREFMHHIHEETDGFRIKPQAGAEIAEKPGDGGYAIWSGEPWRVQQHAGDPDGGAVISALGASTPLPPVYWGRTSGMECIDRVVSDVWREGWSHHITRLMILSNFATLLDVSPRELTDWFWVAYVDAYDWVVEPNVLGLGTFATGNLFTTKPYVSGANYIRRMSDYCDHCQFVPGETCPFTPLYWAFLERHRALLENNSRLRILYRGMKGRGARDQDVFERVRERLLEGAKLTPDDTVR